MALVQMRTPGGSYSMVDAELVDDYEGQGWTRTSALAEFEAVSHTLLTLPTNREV